LAVSHPDTIVGLDLIAGRGKRALNQDDSIQEKEGAQLVQS